MARGAGRLSRMLCAMQNKLCRLASDSAPVALVHFRRGGWQGHGAFGFKIIPAIPVSRSGAGNPGEGCLTVNQPENHRYEVKR